MGVLKRVGQRFLPDVEKVFLPGQGELRQLALCLKLCVERRPGVSWRFPIRRPFVRPALSFHEGPLRHVDLWL